MNNWESGCWPLSWPSPFLGQPGLPAVPWPADYDRSAIGQKVGYVRRDGGHGISAYDWMWMTDFADKIWNQ